MTEVKRKYGYDFSDYSKPSLHRRINRFFLNWKFRDVEVFKNKLISDKLFFEYFLQELTVTVTEMFRDPSFFKILAYDIFPILKKMPFIRIWHAGCSTGQEAYSLAILLKEHGLLEKCRIYATDINSKLLDVAKNGVFPPDLIEKYETNYLKSGGKNKFSDYYAIVEGKAKY
ncbi:MAG: protein-glutamate O-methyltransferase CheR, partial [Bacteroidetes bacterium]|nr:protein-glutamate O-methyltransferase CheR [Bacteroidota bacterium]